MEKLVFLGAHGVAQRIAQDRIDLSLAGRRRLGCARGGHGQQRRCRVFRTLYPFSCREYGEGVWSASIQDAEASS
jgi:hypothetical protein